MSKPRALITGASAGLGREFAEQLAASGKDLVLVARRVAPMQALAEALVRGHGIQVDVIGKDLSDPAAPGDYNYGPTKAYLIAFSRELSAALKSEGIKVCALCPGFTHTDFHASEKLSRMKRSLPKFIWYDADVVVREGLAALEKGRAVYVSGRLYRYLMPVLRSPIGRLSARFLSARL